MSGFFLSGSKKGSRSSLRQNLESVVLALMLAFFVRAFIAQPFKIPSSSMEPSLLVGDYIIVKKFEYGTTIPFSNIRVLSGKEIKRGDVVVFKKFKSAKKKKKTYFIKRVIATGGDIVEIRGRGIFVNGTEILQSYAGPYQNNSGEQFERYLQRFPEGNVDVLYQKGLYSTYKGKTRRPLLVPAGHIFLVGDNRDNSQDSRLWGTVAREDVVGKAVFIHWSWTFQKSLIPQIRWQRIFSEIK